MALAQRSRAFTLIEMLVVIGSVALLLAIVAGLWDNAREQAGISLCATRLNKLGRALQLYAMDHSGMLPDTGAASTLGGQPPADGHVADTWDFPGSGQWPRERRTGNAGNLYLLLRLGLAEPEDFVCPGAGDRAMLGHRSRERFSFIAYRPGTSALTAEEAEFMRIRSGRHCSYSFQNMLAHPRTDSAIAPAEVTLVNVRRSPADLAILADHNPYTQMRGQGRACLDPADDPAANSLNHAGKGQNVLYLGGHVEWHGSPECGARLPDGSRDNIYTPAAGRVDDPRNIPRHSLDSYLVP